MGRYASVIQISVKTSTAEYLMRSANPPTISAHVIPAKVAWNDAKVSSGMVPDSENLCVARSIMPLKNRREKTPMSGPTSVKARVYQSLNNRARRSAVQGKHGVERVVIGV